jgi:chorismate-pyruvate lyase
MKLLANGSPRLAGEKSSRRVEGVASGDLTERHFTMQHAAQAADLTNLEVGALDPQLRGLLFTDGTVTRALEAQTLCHVAVEVVEQSLAALSTQAAGYLDVSDTTPCLRRRVTMSCGSATSAVWAESHILLERVPTGFLGRLDNTPHGIGGSIEQTRLESRRELLWFRLGRSPDWASAASANVVIRLYRIITKDKPALLISESFAVELVAGTYRPLGWGVSEHGVNLSTSSNSE